MTYVSLSQATRYYALATQATLSWRSVEHLGLERFAEAVFALTRLAREQDDDVGWRESLYPARRARNIATTVPLPFSHPGLGVAPLLDRLEQSLAALRVYGGDDASAAGEAVLAEGRALVGLDDAPLLDTILDVASSGRRVANGVVLPMPEYAGVVREQIGRRRPDIEFLGRHQVPGLSGLGRLTIVGPLYWYDGHQFVITSPRAPEIVAVKWAWYRERPPTTASLEDSRGKAGIRIRAVPPLLSSFEATPEDERTAVDWTSVSRELSSAHDSDVSESVLARPAILAGNFAVLLPEDRDRHVWLLDPYAPAADRVAQVDVEDLEPGHVIILRTSGGGDLVVPIADEILGHEAPRMRELQRRWKTKLRSWVRQHGAVRYAAAELRRLGCTRATPQNLQNWLSERLLRTKNRADWQVLMGAISLSREAETIWQAMARLHSAHTRAGKSIAHLLREMANTSALDELLASGRQVFAFDRGGSVTAFRIEAFAPSTVDCASDSLLVPIEVREEWLT